GRVAAVAVAVGAVGAGRTSAAGGVVRCIDADAVVRRRTGAATEGGRVLDRSARRGRGGGAGGHRRRGLGDRAGLSRLVAGGGEGDGDSVTKGAGLTAIGAGRIRRHRTRRVAGVAM